ncbi:MAG: tetratricopeptide repeat protein [Sphingobacteriaceae bacterium]|nr:MAG: tetratricopeptide repeat protein [Sphingobacteriaceae bacterium]
MYCFNPVPVKRVKIFFYSILLVLACHAADAQNPENTKGFGTSKTAGGGAIKGKTYAIIAGVSKYPYIRPLKYAADDARLFRDFLMSPAGGGLKLNDDIFFKEDAEVKWLPWLTEAQGWLKKKNLTENDRLFVYFSGHGDAYEDDYFLLTYDCNPQNDPNLYKATALNMDYLKKGLVIPPLRKGAQVILILDACRSNELPGGAEGLKKFIELAVEPNAILPGELQMLSTGAGTESYETQKVGDGHGLFTYYLIDALYGAADMEGDAANNNGKVEFEELSSWVRNKVRKDAMLYFKKEQKPVFKPVEKDTEVISIIDKTTYDAWVKSKELSKITAPGEMLAVTKKPGNGKANAVGEIDTVLLAVYNKFISAMKDEKLIGENSAESFYNEMEKKWPGNAITDDARYDLAGMLLDFGQQKINLYLSGKGFTQIQSLESGMQKVSAKGGEEAKGLLPDGAQQLNRMKVIVNTTFDKAAKMMEKAAVLLKDEPDLLDAVNPKLYFLKAAALNTSTNKTKLLEGVRYCRKAMAVEANAAYNYLLMGQLLYSLNNDSCEYYFLKATQLAPKWAYPLNGLANYYSDNNKNNLAISYYRKAIALDTLNSFVIQNLGSVYHNLQMPDSAKQYYYRALAINPCDENSNANLGSLYTDSIDLAKPSAKHYIQLAEKFFKKSIACDKEYTWAYDKLAQLFIKINKPDSAIFYLQKGVDANPDDALACRNLADVLLSQKDTTGAEKAYLKGIAADKDDREGYITLADFYGKTDNVAKGPAFYELFLKKYPNAQEAHNSMGILYHNIDRQKALLYYKKALAVNPKLTYVLSNIANIYSHQNNTAEAMVYYKKVLQIDSTYMSAYRGLAYLYSNNNKTDTAIMYYQKALSIDSTDVTSNFNLAHIYRMADLGDKAIPYYEKVLRLDPKDPDPYHALGIIYGQKGEIEKAGEYYAQALALDPADADYYWHLGQVNYVLGNRLNNKGDKQNAKVYYEKGIELFLKGSTLSDVPESYFSKIGAIYIRKDGTEKAISYYNDIIKQYPQYSAEMYSYLGDAYRNLLKDYPAAITAYKKGLEHKQSEPLYTGLGYSYLYSEQVNPAIEAFNKAIVLSPKNGDCYYNLACAYSINKDAVYVIETLAKAFENGYVDYDHFMQDSDLAFARTLPEFTTLVKKHFPNK